MAAERCSKCGALNPQFAAGKSPARNLADRLLIYEGYTPRGMMFTFKRDPMCLSCRTGKKAKVRVENSGLAGEALTQWLIGENERR